MPTVSPLYTVGFLFSKNAYFLQPILFIDTIVSVKFRRENYVNL